MIGAFVLLCVPLLGQARRVWVLRVPGEMVEYDPATFAVRQRVKLPPEALQSPASVSVNSAGQILFAPPVSIPLGEEDLDAAHKVWLWNGKTASTIDLGLKRETGTAGSNQTVTETVPFVFLSADGAHLFWFANHLRRMQREEVDLSVTTTWQVWQTDLSGAGREELISSKIPECRCTTGSCEETCPYGLAWVPDGGVEKFFLMTEFVQGKNESSYKASTRFQMEGGKWTATVMSDSLKRVLDALSDGSLVVTAIPDTGCCGWSNQSNDQTVLMGSGKTQIMFDEQAAYKNPDYDVSFFTANARLSPGAGYVAMTINATARANAPIQLAEEGQANPEESKAIRKNLADLPAVEVKSMEESPKRVAFLPRATLVGWMSEKEMLIVEEHVLVVYTVGTGARRKSSVRVEDAGRVFVR